MRGDELGLGDQQPGGVRGVAAALLDSAPQVLDVGTQDGIRRERERLDE